MSARRNRIVVLLVVLVSAASAFLFSPDLQSAVYSAVYSSGSPSLRAWAVARLDKIGDAGNRTLLLALDDEVDSIGDAAGEALGSRDLMRIGGALIGVRGRSERFDLRSRSLLFDRIGEAQAAIFQAAEGDDTALRRRAFAQIFEVLNAPVRGFEAPLDRMTSRANRSKLKGVRMRAWTYFLESSKQTRALDRPFVVIGEKDLESFETRRCADLARSALDDPDSDTAFLSAIILYRLHQLRPRSVKFLDEGIFEPLFTTPQRRDAYEESARREGINAISHSQLRAFIQAEPERRGLALLNTFIADTNGSQDFEERGLLRSFVIEHYVLLPDHPKVDAAVMEILEAFRQRDPRVWPQVCFLIEALQPPLETFNEALSAIQFDHSAVSDSALRLLMLDTSVAGQKALQSRLASELRSKKPDDFKEAVALCKRGNIVLQGEGFDTILKAASTADEAVQRILLLYLDVLFSPSPKKTRQLAQKLARSKVAFIRDGAKEVLKRLDEEGKG